MTTRNANAKAKANANANAKCKDKGKMQMQGERLGREDSLAWLDEEGDGYGVGDGSAGGGYGVGISAGGSTRVVDGRTLFDAADGWDAHGQEKSEETRSPYREVAEGEFAEAAAAGGDYHLRAVGHGQRAGARPGRY